MVDLINNVHVDLDSLSTQTQGKLDSYVSTFVQIMYTVCGIYRLVSKRSAANSCAPSSVPRCTTPIELRSCRREASKAKQVFIKAMASGASSEVVQHAKNRWNLLSSKCHKLSRAARRNTCLSWNRMWDNMRRNTPRSLWSIVRHFTALGRMSCGACLDPRS